MQVDFFYQSTRGTFAGLHAAFKFVLDICPVEPWDHKCQSSWSAVSHWLWGSIELCLGTEYHAPRRARILTNLGMSRPYYCTYTSNFHHVFVVCDVFRILISSRHKVMTWAGQRALGEKEGSNWRPKRPEEFCLGFWLQIFLQIECT